jgi:hypothetical protein
LSGRVRTAAGNFFDDPLPRADVITMGMILHDWNLEKKMHLIRAAYDALPQGGALIAIEALIDDARRENLPPLLTHHWSSARCPPDSALPARVAAQKC